MKYIFKKYSTIFILFIPLPLFGIDPPNLKLCYNIKFPNTTTYKEPKDGSIIAKRLNKRFNNLVSECEGKYKHPAYECSGIILRAISPDKYEFWKGGEAYSYFRSDLNTYKFHLDRPIAYVINGSSRYVNPYGKQAYVKCAYPIDGYTKTRPSNNEYKRGCTKSTLFPNIPGECAKRGINTLKEWQIDFNKVPVSEGAKRYAHQCSFDANRVSGTEEFALSLEARRSLNLTYEYREAIQNEIVIKSWDDTDYKPQDIPVEAIIYSDYQEDHQHSAIHALPYARAMQCAYVKATIDNAGPGKRIKYPIPIIYFDLYSLLNFNDKNPFRYRRKDQVIVAKPKSKLVPEMYLLKVY
ncbi:MAG: hypothetical protein LBI71_05190 [Enterobacteriaceae bacterium]|jgi:hypothetical protein|nr:hypothetical protein [Enterobacteriaceae bacterium]